MENLRPAGLRKIVVLGSSGSGKTTFTRRLAAILNVEAVHLDSYFWQPNWVEPDRRAWEKTIDRLLLKESWVMDGNYTGSLERRLNHADTAIFLDYPRRVCMWRCFQRFLQFKGRNRPDLAQGCNEKIDWDFFQWIWSYPKRRRPWILEKLAERAGDLQVHILRSDQQVELFLKAAAGESLE